MAKKKNKKGGEAKATKAMASPPCHRAILEPVAEKTVNHTDSSQEHGWR